MHQQARELLSRTPDVVALQEVTPRSIAAWAEALRDGGLPHVRATVDESSAVRRGPHACSVLIGSRHPFLDAASVAFLVPGWDEKVLSVVLDTPVGELAVHTVHIPNGSANGWAKIEVLEAVHAGVSARCRDRLTVLCGDFNTPRCELASGEIVTGADVTGRRTQMARRFGGSGLRGMPVTQRPSVFSVRCECVPAAFTRGADAYWVMGTRSRSAPPFRSSLPRRGEGDQLRVPHIVARGGIERPCGDRERLRRLSCMSARLEDWHPTATRFATVGLLTA